MRTKGGEMDVIEIKYERLPTFFHECRTIGHIKEGLSVGVEEGKDEEKQ